MFEFLKRLVSPAATTIINDAGGPRLAATTKYKIKAHIKKDPAKLRALMTRYREMMALQNWRGNLLPPPSGKRRPEFSSKDDIFWTTADGTIKTELVNPKKSIWSTFK
jgi:hypothetical protein